MKAVVAAALAAWIFSLGAEEPPLETAESIDIERYLGDWYEIARFDHSFQRGCTATKADYSRREDLTSPN